MSTVRKALVLLLTPPKARVGGSCSHHWKEEYVGESEVHIHPWLCDEFQTSLGYIRPCLKMKTRNKQKQENKLSVSGRTCFQEGQSHSLKCIPTQGWKEAANYMGRFTDLAVSQVTDHQGAAEPLLLSKLGHQEKGAIYVQ